MHQISWTNNWREQTNSQSPLSGTKRCVIVRVFSLIRTGCQNKVIKIQWPSLAIKPSVLHSNENDLQNRMFALPYWAQVVYISKKGAKFFFFFFFFLAVKKNILMHRHFWLCVKLSNPAPYFRLRYLLLFLPSLGEPVPFRTDFYFTGNGCATKIYS